MNELERTKNTIKELKKELKENPNDFQKSYRLNVAETYLKLLQKGYF